MKKNEKKMWSIVVLFYIFGDVITTYHGTINSTNFEEKNQFIINMGINEELILFLSLKVFIVLFLLSINSCMKYSLYILDNKRYSDKLQNSTYIIPCILAVLGIVASLNNLLLIV